MIGIGGIIVIKSRTAWIEAIHPYNVNDVAPRQTPGVSRCWRSHAATNGLHSKMRTKKQNMKNAQEMMIVVYRNARAFFESLGVRRSNR